MAMIQCKECSKDISSSAAACPNCGAPQAGVAAQSPPPLQAPPAAGKKKNRVLSAFIWLCVVLLVFYLIGATCGKDASTPRSTTTSQEEAAPATEQAPAAPKAWTEITSLSGNGNKKGQLFTLTGNQARIKYSLSGDMCMLAVYVVDEGSDIMENGGFPEVTQDEAGSGETILHGKRGNFYLNVMGANGDWKVVVEEMR